MISAEERFGSGVVEDVGSIGGADGVEEIFEGAIVSSYKLVGRNIVTAFEDAGFYAGDIDLRVFGGYVVQVISKTASVRPVEQIDLVRV